VREGKKETAASFDYGARLTEFTLLGNLAQHAGVGNKIEWNGPKMKVTNLPELNRWLSATRVKDGPVDLSARLLIVRPGFERNGSADRESGAP